MSLASGIETDKSLFAVMVAGRQAEYEVESIISEILEVDIIGIGFDHYDNSLEIYPISYVMPTQEQYKAILNATGCSQYWLNFEDGKEIHNTKDNRVKQISNQWKLFNENKKTMRAAKLVELHNKILSDKTINQDIRTLVLSLIKAKEII